MKVIKVILITILAMSAVASGAKFTIIKTGSAKSLEALIYEDGSLFKTMEVNHSGFLIEEDGKYLLFETGLGEEIDSQFSSDMPFWAKPLFDYKKGISIKQQLKNKYNIEKIILSHSHWDHASGIKDFPQTTALVSEEEIHEIEHIVANRTFPSQFSGAKVDQFKWTMGNYEGFEKYYDITGSGNLILVPLFGHTDGSVGLFLIGEKKKYFFVGDSIWTTRQLNPPQSKAFISSKLVDTNKKETFKQIKVIKDIQDKGYEIIPTHDYYLQEELGYFPNWLR